MGKKKRSWLSWNALFTINMGWFFVYMYVVLYGIRALSWVSSFHNLSYILVWGVCLLIIVNHGSPYLDKAFEYVPKWRGKKL